MNSPHAVKNTGLSIQYGSDTHNLLHGDKNTEDHDESQIPNDLMVVNIPSSQCEPTPKDGGDDSNIPRSEKEALIADSEHTTVPLRTYLALDDAMTKIGFGLFQWHVVIICGCILGADAMEIVLLSFILPLLRAEFLLDSVQLSILTGLVFAGMAVGATMFGTISDNFGRRTSFIASSIIVSVSGLISCLSINAFMFACCRFFTGLGLGGTHVAFSLVTEVLPVNRRGSLTGMQSFWVLAIIFQCCVAWLLESQNSWRALAFVSACPGAIATLCMFTLSESPRVLLQQGRSAEALQVLQRAARWNRVPPLPDDIQLILDSKDQEKDDCISLETPPTQIREPHEEGNTSPQNREPETSHMLQDSHSHPEETTHTSGAARRPEQRGPENVDVKEPSKWRLLLLFSGKMLRLTPPLLVLWFAISSLYYGIIMMSDGLFTSRSLYFTNTMSALIEGPAYIMNILVIRLVGRVNCMKISMSITLISLLCMWGWQSNKIFVFTMALIIRFSAASTFAVICVYTPEALPTNIRSTGFGLCYFVARIAGILTQFVAIAILETNPSASILIYTFLAFFGLISAFALPFDTSNRELSDN